MILHIMYSFISSLISFIPLCILSCDNKVNYRSEICSVLVRVLVYILILCNVFYSMFYENCISYRFCYLRIHIAHQKDLPLGFYLLWPIAHDLIYYPFSAHGVFWFGICSYYLAPILNISNLSFMVSQFSIFILISSRL